MSDMRIDRQPTSTFAVALGLLLLVTFPAAGDAVSDLRATLQKYPANDPFIVSASLRVSGDSQGVAGAQAGSTNFEAELGARGLAIRVPPATLGMAETEAANKKRNPENQTPTRTALVALTIFDVIDALDVATMLLNDLNGATLIEQAASTHAGKSATLLRLKVKSTLAGTSSRFVNEAQIELRVWIDGNGTPVAAERDSNYSASFLFVKAGNVRKERWELAVAGDRLYASRNEEEDRATAIGRSVVRSRSVVYVPKPRAD
jgi:hypothetical protein